MGSVTAQVLEELVERAREIRVEVIRMLVRAGSGHAGGSLSAADMIAVLYHHHLDIGPARPDWENRDRFILSKGHAAPALYVALAQTGFIPREELMTLRQTGSRLQGHPSSRATPGVDASTGSLGQGLSVGIGMALGARLQWEKFQIYVMMGDGETDEGSVWEAAAAAAHFSLGNLVAIIDNNELQLDGPCCEIMHKRDLAAKWRAFGWHVIETDGHDVARIVDAFDKARDYSAGPAVVIAKTTKGKGVSFMENRYEWHGKPVTEEDAKIALGELGAGETA